MPEDSLNAHIAYLEEEVKKMEERAARLEAMIPDLKGEKKLSSVALVNRLRDEVNEHRKYISVMKRK